MYTDHKNPFDLLGEIELNAGAEAEIESETDVFAEVRFDEDEIEIEGLYSIQVTTSRATLKLELWGCDIVPGSRLNDQSKVASTFELTRRRKKVAAAAIEGGGKFASSSPVGTSVEIGTNATLGTREDEEISEARSWEDRFVTCKSGKRWLIEEDSEGGLPLSGTYIDNKRLCSMASKEHSNKVEISAELSIRRRDLIVEPEGTQIQAKFRKMKHQQKFIGAIIAKSIVEQSDQQSTELTSGRIVIGKSTLRTNEDEN